MVFKRTTPTVLLLAVAILALPLPARAEGTWGKLRPESPTTEICLSSGGQRFDYLVLDSEQAVEFEVKGPRRVKLINRCVGPDGQLNDQRFTVEVKLDGVEVLRKSFSARVNKDMTLCQNEADISSLRRAYVEVPKGTHSLHVTATADSENQVVCRIYQQSRRKKSTTVSFAPESYSELATLQFESGAQSTYYRFETDTPLRFVVSGPTTLQLYTRMDFQAGMLGSQKYSLEVWRDGELWRTFHYDVTRLANAFYPSHLEMLPGTRKRLKIAVPDGPHQFEVRCLRPNNCGIAAQIRIPRKDLQGRP